KTQRNKLQAIGHHGAGGANPPQGAAHGGAHDRALRVFGNSLPHDGAPRNHECRCQGKCDCYEVRKHGTYRSEKPAEVEMGDRVGTAVRLSSACRCPDPVSITGTSVSK